MSKWTSENTQQIFLILIPIWIISFLKVFEIDLNDMKRDYISSQGDSSFNDAPQSDRLSNYCMLTTASLIKFWIHFVILGVGLMIFGTARCISIEKLFTKYHQNKFIIRTLNILFIVAGTMFIAMSFIPCDLTKGHQIIANIGVIALIMAQIIDIACWFYIQQLCLRYTQKPACRMTIFPIISLCFIMLIIIFNLLQHSSAIWQWIAIFLSFLLIMWNAIHASFVSKLLKI